MAILRGTKLMKDAAVGISDGNELGGCSELRIKSIKKPEERNHGRKEEWQ